MIMCLSPILLKLEKTGKNIFVGCGRCPLCLSKKANQWFLRLQMEAKSQNGNYFITLTYSNENLPNALNNGKDIVIKFLKRFRKAAQAYGLRDDFKYYLINELGENHGRLHYHALFFHTGFDWRTMRDLIDKTWKQGRIDVQHVIKNRIHYVTKYCLQNVAKPRPITLHDAKGRPYRVYPEPYFFMLGSKGLGLDSFDEDVQKYVREHNGEFTFNGKKFQLPKYLFNKCYEDKESMEFLSASLRRLAAAVADTKEYIRQWQEFCEVNPGATFDPDFIKEIAERSRQVEKFIKKCNFIKPPSYVNFRHNQS